MSFNAHNLQLHFSLSSFRQFNCEENETALASQLYSTVITSELSRITVNSPQNLFPHPTNSPHYQLAPTNSPHLFYHLAPLLLPTRPMLFVNSTQFSDQLAPLLLETYPTALTKSPHDLHFSDQVGCAYDCS